MNTKRKFPVVNELAAKALIGIMIVAVPTPLRGQTTNNTAANQTVNNTNSIEKRANNLKLSESQLLDYFGIGRKPENSNVFIVGEGWKGPAVYKFMGTGDTTYFLKTELELGNCYYLIYGKQMAENGVLLPVDPKVKKAVDKANNPRLKLFRGAIGVVEAPARAVGGISPGGVGVHKGPVNGGVTSPGVEAGSAGTVAPTTKTQPQNTTSVQTTNQPTTDLTSTDQMIKNLENALTPEQLRTYFGIGNILPYNVTPEKFSQSGGWQKKGIYNFDREKFSTPPLDNQVQLAYWEYAITEQLRRAEEIADKPLDPAIKSAIDRARGNSK
ncbi:MAG: hypothetical protein ABR981_03050 [Candidatus Micrarchaeaceae archaeon]|jgi:hypothetical protein